MSFRAKSRNPFSTLTEKEDFSIPLRFSRNDSRAVVIPSEARNLVSFHLKQFSTLPTSTPHQARLSLLQVRNPEFR